MDYSVKDFYVPTITYFTSGNKLTGSRTGMNYKMTPIEDKEILVQVWYGPMSSIAGSSIPMTKTLPSSAFVV